MGDDSRPPATGYPVQPYPPPPQHHHSSSAAPAYPYPQPQHQQQPNPYFYNNNNNNYPYDQTQPQQHTYYVDQQRTAFIRRVIAGMLAVFIIIGCIFFITWLVLRPKFPDFTIDSATVSGFNISGTAVSGAWDFRVTVLNPNKKVNIVYEEVESNLAYKSNSIADNTLAPFRQGKRDLTTIRVSFASNAAYLREKAAAALTADRGTDGVVPFEVRIYSRVLFDAGIWRIRRRLLRVLCDNVLISITNGSSGSGNMTGGAKGCRVGW